MTLGFFDNPLLTNIDGLINYSGKSQLDFHNNPALNNINGINNFEPCGTTLNIYNNPQLAVCNNDCICEIMTKGYNWGFSINNVIENNAPGCNSASEILAECNPEDFHLIDTTIYFCAGTSYELNGVIYTGDTLICEDIPTGEFTFNVACYDTRCTRLLTKVPYGNDTRQVGCDIFGEFPSDWFGYSIAMSADGSRVAVGAPAIAGSSPEPGYVRIFEFNGGAWVQLGQELIGELGDDGFGYSIDLSGDGNRIVIGAYLNDNFDWDAGEVKVFEYNGNSWDLLGNEIYGEPEEKWIGYEVTISLDGNRISTVATFLNNASSGQNQNNRQAKIFEYNGNDWIQLGAEIDYLEFYPSAEHSISLSEDGNRIALGSPTTGSGNVGYTRVFEYTNGTWQLLGSIINGIDGATWSGRSVSLSNDGNRLAIGESHTTSFAGRVKVFEFNNTDWIQLGTDMNGDGNGNVLGQYVSISGDGNKLAVGARGDIEVFNFDGNDWVQNPISFNSDAPANSLISAAISNDGNFIASGHVEPSFNNNIGLTRVFQCSDNFVSADTTIYICEGETVEVDCNTYSTDTIVCYNQIANYGNGDVCYQYCTEIIAAPTYNITNDTTICEGENLTFNGVTVSSDTSFCVDLQTVFGCDSMVCLNLAVIPNIETSETVFACPDDYTIPQTCTTFSSVVSGCDSIHCINYIQVDTFYTTQNESICDGDFFTFDGFNYTTDTSFCNTYPTVFGCDSTVCFSLSIVDSVLVNDVVFICEGEGYDFNGTLLNTDTTVCVATQTANGCDSTFCLTVSLLDTVMTQEEVLLCQGDEFTYGGQTTSTNTTLFATSQGINTCDSTHYVNVIFQDTAWVTETISICPDETYLFNGVSLNSDTTVCVSSSTINGCDSTYCLTLNILNIVATSEVANICQGEIYTWNNNTFTSDTLLCETLTGSNGCDSTHCINLSVLDTISTSQMETICEGTSYNFDGNILQTDTTLCLNYISSIGCDSVHCVTISLTDTAQTFLFATICDGENFQVGNSTYTTTGIYTDILLASNGCDSTVITELTVEENPMVSITVGADICLGDVATLDAGLGYENYLWSTGATTSTIEVSQAGNYTVTVSDINGCSSAATLNFSGPVLLESTLSSIFDYNGYGVSCAGLADGGIEVVMNGGALPYTYLWSTGQTTATINQLAEGTYTVTVTDNNGCTIEDAALLLAPPNFLPSYTFTPPSCFGENDGTLTVEVLGMTSPYTFALDGISQNTNTFFSLASGEYELMVSDANQCSWSETIFINEPAEMVVEINPTEVELQLGDSVVLNAFTNSVIASAQWSPANNLSCDTCLTTTVLAFENTTYQLSLIDTNGCVAIGEVNVKVKNEKPIFIPNAFSPNGDGYNDVFTVYAGIGVERVKVFRVFNRWGKEVFNATNFSPNDETYGWDANQNKKQDDIGVYIYYVEVLYVNGKTEIFKGDVLLTR